MPRVNAARVAWRSPLTSRWSSWHKLQQSVAALSCEWWWRSWGAALGKSQARVFGCPTLFSSVLFNSLWRIPRFSWASFFLIFIQACLRHLFFCFIDQSVWVLLTLMTKINVLEALKNSWKVRWSVTVHKRITRSLKQNVYCTIDNQNTQKCTCAAHLVKSKVSKTLHLQINFKWSYRRE